MNKKEKSIGSYFHIELQKQQGNCFHPNAILLNTGRNALEYIIKVLDITKIYLPFFSCDALYTPLKRTGIKFEFYNIDSQLNPIFDYSRLRGNEFLLYINYFGIKNNTVNNLSQQIRNLIIDNSQSFFSKAIDQVPTFYSVRKFFGVSDGSILLNVPDNLNLEKDKSAGRMEYLLLRLENEVEMAYEKYREVENELDKVPLLNMSEITKNILFSIDLGNSRKIRNDNFKYMHSLFGEINKIKIESFDGPLVYPLYHKNGFNIKKELIKSRIYIPTYWPNVIENCDKISLEYDFVNNIISIPIDQRYSLEILSRVVEKVNLHI